MSSISSVSMAASPLTTMFATPDWCLDNIYSASFNGTGFFGLGTPCGALNDSCFPPQVNPAAPASIFDLQPFLYSPGLKCPLGYYTATTTDLNPTITVAACCPSGLVPNGEVCEGIPGYPFTATGCDNTTNVYKTTLGASAHTASAALIFLAWEESDLARTGSVMTTQSNSSTINIMTPTPNLNSSSSPIVVSTAGPLPKIQITPQPWTASISKATSTTVSGAHSQRAKIWGPFVLCGLAAGGTIMGMCT